MQTSRILRSAAGVILCLASASALAKPVKPVRPSPSMQTYSDNEVVEQASQFFSTGAKDPSQVILKVIKEWT